MYSLGWTVLSALYSIDLYAINLKKRCVPERSIEVSEMNHRFRCLISAVSESEAFGRNLGEGSFEEVSFQRMKQSKVLNLVSFHPAAEVM
jgi:hypothetical protein